MTRPESVNTAGRTREHVASAAELQQLAAAILEGLGASPAAAAVVAESLVESNLQGHDSHGVRRLLWYMEPVRTGRIDPSAEPWPESPRQASVVIHGRRAFGQLAARLAVRELCRIAPRNAVAVAAIRDCNHVGRLGEYVAELAEHGLIGMALCNADPTVAPYGGSARRLGTNPMAWALPRAPGHPPVVVDWATAALAEGKLAVAQEHGEQLPPGTLLDPEGRPSVDPADFYRGGALLPFGGHKGYGLSVVIEVIGGLLSGGGISCLPGYDGGFGTVMVAIDVATFLPVHEFRAQVEAFCVALRGAPATPGHDHVMAPGEPEELTRMHRREHGIPVPVDTWRELHDLLHAVTPS